MIEAWTIRYRTLRVAVTSRLEAEDLRIELYDAEWLHLAG